MPRVLFRNVLDVDTASPVSVAVPAGVVALTGVAPSVVNSGSGGDLFTMDLSSGAVPNAGFDGTSGDEELGVSITRTHLPTGGPTGGGAYRFEWIYDAAQQDAPNGWGGQFYYGWGVDLGTAPGDGVSRFVRFKLRVVAGSNCRGTDWTDGSGPAMTSSKLVILGDGASGRMILELRCFPDTAAYELRPARDGGGYGTNTATIGDWVAIQMEGVTGASGLLRLWIDNNVQGSPDEEQTGLSMGAATWDQFAAGYYCVNGIASDGTFAIDIGGIEVSTTFDAGWSV